MPEPRVRPSRFAPVGFDALHASVPTRYRLLYCACGSAALRAGFPYRIGRQAGVRR